MLAVAVEEVIRARAVQSLAHRPDVRLDDALAEFTAERQVELREKVSGIVRRHVATFAPVAPAGKAAAAARPG